MKRLLLAMIAVIFMAVIFHTSCKRSHQPALADGNFPDSVARIIVSKCTYVGCHNQASYQNAGQLLLDSWDHLFQGCSFGAAVVAYSPKYSPLLYYCCPDSTLGNVIYDPNHFNKHPAPTAAEYRTLVNWVTHGAPDKNGNVPFADNADNRQKIYLTQSGCNLLAVIDGKSKLVMRYIPVGNATDTHSQHDVEMTSDGKFAFVSFYFGNLMEKIDTRIDTVVGITDMSSVVAGGQAGWSILYVSPGDTDIMVSGYYNNYLVSVKPATMAIDQKLSADAVNVGFSGSGLNNPHGITSNAAFDTFFVTMEFGNAVAKVNFNHPGYWSKLISVDGNTASSTAFPGSPDPHQVEMAPDGSKYFVSCENSNEIRVMDTNADTLIRAIAVGAFPQEMTLYESKHYLFVACLNDSVNRAAPPSIAGNVGTVFVIDYNTYQVVKILKGDFNTPHDLAIDTVDGYIYVASRNVYNGGIPPHHTTPCGGNAGWYTVYDLNTLEPADNIRYEVTNDPYAIIPRF